MSRSPTTRRPRRRPRARTTSTSRPRRGATKISVTVDAGVLHDIRQLIGASGTSLSSHISEALARDLRRRHLQRLIEEYEAEHGVITEAELAEIRAQWQA
jgi:hypothetical protein